MLIMIICFIILLAVFISLFVFNIMRSKKLMRIIVLVGDGLGIAVLIGVYIFSRVDAAAIKTAAGEYGHIYSGGLLSHCYYEGSDESWHYIREPGWFGASDNTAIPAENVTLPDDIKEGCSVILVFTENLKSDRTITAGDKKYSIGDSITHIFRNYSGLRDSIVFNVIIIGFFFNVIAAIIVGAQLPNKTENSADTTTEVIDMNDKKKAKGNHNEFPLRDDMCLTDSVSTTDATGAVPSGSVDSAEEFDSSNRTHRYSQRQ